MEKALLSGLIGAVALTLLHETARKFVSEAPRVDVVGERALAKTMQTVGQAPPPEKDLYNAALAGDLISNSIYYSLIGMGNPKKAVWSGALLGATAGIGAVVLPEKLGLGEGPTARTNETALMTIAWYTIGGLSAGIAYQMLSK